jgi:hypothetical protein
MDSKKLVYSAFFITLGIILPMAFHLVGMGKVFLPMHIPVLIAGMVSGRATGMLVGSITPLLSSLLTGMPPMMPPMAQGMVFELAAYGWFAGELYHRRRLNPYIALAATMIAGRLVYGVIGALVLPLLGINGIPVFYPVTAGLITGLPGLALQIIFIPPVIKLICKYAFSS